MPFSGPVAEARKLQRAKQDAVDLGLRRRLYRRDAAPHVRNIGCGK